MTAAKTPTMDGFRVAPEISAETARWLSHLGAERRMSAKTLDAYQRDVSQFLSFLTDHLGSAPTLKQLGKLTPADIRAFMAARRNEGAGNRSLMRTLAGCRSFARFLERNGKGKFAALAAVRTPKLPLVVNGAGDAIAALFFAHYLREPNLGEALSSAVSAIFGVLAKTVEKGAREIQLVSAQDEIVKPSRMFKAEALV